MLSVIVDWNPDLPLVASQAFTTAGRAFRDGEPFPWRELGIDEQAVYAMWRSGFVSHPLSSLSDATVVPAQPVAPQRKQPRR